MKRTGEKTVLVRFFACPFSWSERQNMSKEAAAAAVSTIVYCIIHISHNDLPEFPSATLSSIDDATASPHSSALQNENSFYVILLKVDGIVH